jgi:hypothetical protein
MRPSYQLFVLLYFKQYIICSNSAFIQFSVGLVIFARDIKQGGCFEQVFAGQSSLKRMPLHIGIGLARPANQMCQMCLNREQNYCRQR